MTFLLLAALPAATALLLFVSLMVSVVVRTLRGEQWSLSMTQASLENAVTVPEDSPPSMALVS